MHLLDKKKTSLVVAKTKTKQKKKRGASLVLRGVFSKVLYCDLTGKPFSLSLNYFE